MQKLVSIHSSFIKQLLLYFYVLVQHLGKDLTKHTSPLDILIYVGSDNQYLSLEPTIDRIKALGLTVSIVASHQLYAQFPTSTFPITLTFFDFTIVVIISLIRLPFILLAITKIRNIKIQKII